MNQLLLSFGKHRGKQLSEIPRDYVAWLAQQAYQPEVRAAAARYLEEHPVAEPATRQVGRQPGPAPRTYREVMKLSWMAGKKYGNARATLLAARDADGFLMVVDEEDDEEHAVLLVIADDGTAHDASYGFAALPYERVAAVLARYPQVDGGDYLAEAAEREAREADEARRRLVLSTSSGSAQVVLLIWDASTIEVEVDGRAWGLYRFRLLTEQERRDPVWHVAAAVLEPIDDGWSAVTARKIGLLPERRQLVEQKIAEVSGEGA